MRDIPSIVTTKLKLAAILLFSFRYLLICELIIISLTLMICMYINIYNYMKEGRFIYLKKRLQLNTLPSFFYSILLIDPSISSQYSSFLCVGYCKKILMCRLTKSEIPCIMSCHNVYYDDWFNVVFHFCIVIHRLILHSCRHFLFYVSKISLYFPPEA